MLDGGEGDKHVNLGFVEIFKISALLQELSFEIEPFDRAGYTHITKNLLQELSLTQGYICTSVCQVSTNLPLKQLRNSKSIRKRPCTHAQAMNKAVNCELSELGIAVRVMPIYVVAATTKGHRGKLCQMT